MQFSAILYLEFSTEMIQRKDYILKHFEILFPKGLAYDTKIEHYRTPVVNEVIGCMAYLSRDMRENKNRTFKDYSKKSGFVPLVGLTSNQFLVDLKAFWLQK